MGWNLYYTEPRKMFEHPPNANSESKIALSFEEVPVIEVLNEWSTLELLAIGSYTRREK